MDEWIEIVAKGVTYLGVIVAVGAVAAAVLEGRVAGLSDPHGRVRGHLHVVYLFAACLCCAGGLLRAWGHTVVAFGFGGAWSLENLQTIAIESRWGHGWQQQAAASLFLLLAGVRQRVSPRPFSRILGACAAVVMCAAVPSTGHAVSQPWGWLLHGAHVLAAGLWTGTLVAVLMVTAPGALRVSLLRTFAPLAGLSVLVLGTSGFLVALLYVGSFANLWTTDYGRVLLVKLSLVAAMVGLGGVNWFRLHRRAVPAVTGAVRVEACLVLLVVMVTAWLTELAHP